MAELLWGLGAGVWTIYAFVAYQKTQQELLIEEKRLANSQARLIASALVQQEALTVEALKLDATIKGVEAAAVSQRPLRYEMVISVERPRDGGESVSDYPIHLLIALLATADRSRDALVKEHGGDPGVLRKTSKRELVSSSGSKRRIAGRN